MSSPPQRFRKKAMTFWINFIVGSFLLVLIACGGLLLYHRKHPSASGTGKPAEDANVLYVLLGLASLSILAYIAFVFGKR